ncbi:MAG: hypothetical protein IAG10_23455 [Planctomycetaceae bacterium]|nr:hypothetical protein [Planctomycetaceae bacterium]
MSFRSSGAESGRAFDCVRRSWRQADDLPFSNVLRCKTPEMVRTELWMGWLAYNLVRHSLLPATNAAECSPRQLSFCAAQQFLATTWLPAAVSSHNLRSLIELRLIHSASHRVGNRPNRIEPREIKHRASEWLSDYLKKFGTASELLKYLVFRRLHRPVFFHGAASSLSLEATETLRQARWNVVEVDSSKVGWIESDWRDAVSWLLKSKSGRQANGNASSASPDL